MRFLVFIYFYFTHFVICLTYFFFWHTKNTADIGDGGFLLKIDYMVLFPASVLGSLTWNLHPSPKFLYISWWFTLIVRFFMSISFHVRPVSSPHCKQLPIAIVRNGTWTEYVPLFIQKSISLFISSSDNGIFSPASCLMFSIAPFAGFFRIKCLDMYLLYIRNLFLSNNRCLHSVVPHSVIILSCGCPQIFFNSMCILKIWSNIFFIIFTIPFLRRIWYNFFYSALLCVRVTCPCQRLRLCKGILFSFNLHTLPFFGSPYMVNGIISSSCGCQIADILNCDFKGIFVMRDTKEEI